MPDQRSVPLAVHGLQVWKDAESEPPALSAGNLGGRASLPHPDSFDPDDMGGLVPLADALVAAGVPIAASTASRWITTGCRGVRLDARRIGARWFTSPVAVKRFVTDCGA